MRKIATKKNGKKWRYQWCSFFELDCHLIRLALKVLVVVVTEVVSPKQQQQRQHRQLKSVFAVCSVAKLLFWCLAFFLSVLFIHSSSFSFIRNGLPMLPVMMRRKMMTSILLFLSAVLLCFALLWTFVCAFVTFHQTSSLAKSDWLADWLITFAARFAFFSVNFLLNDRSCACQRSNYSEMTGLKWVRWWWWCWCLYPEEGKSWLIWIPSCLKLLLLWILCLFEKGQFVADQSVQAGLYFKLFKCCCLFDLSSNQSLPFLSRLNQFVFWFPNSSMPLISYKIRAPKQWRF